MPCNTDMEMLLNCFKKSGFNISEPEEKDNPAP